jgi:hypothetical protein
MIKELILGKITLDSIKFLIEKVAKEKRITLSILSLLSDVTSLGMAFWLILNIIDEEEFEEEESEEEESEEKEVVKSEAVPFKKRNLQFIKRS